MTINYNKLIIKKLSVLLIIFLLSINTINAQIPVEKYKTEISNLKSQEEINQYWQKLKDIDQNKLVNSNNLAIADSISVDQMIRTALLFKILGDSCYKFNNTLPILNLSHSNLGRCQIDFWPIIEKCKKVGGVIESFGGNYPAYELESVSLSFYNYSLLGQEQKYEILLSKLNGKSSDSIVENLLVHFDQYKNLGSLKVKQTLNKWYNQPFTNLKEETFFEFVEMTDNQIYLKRIGYIQKLVEIGTENGFKYFRIENEPFGWTYKYGSDGSLSLLDENKTELIKYSRK